MQELLLFGQVAADAHHELLQQLAGVSRMQPIPFTERHLVFRALPPTGLTRVQQGGGSQGVQPPEVQRTKAALQGPLYHVQLVRDITEDLASSSHEDSDVIKESGLIANGHSQTNTIPKAAKFKATPWTIEFRDIPDPGAQPVTSRHLSRTVVEDGSPAEFLSSLGYEYGTEYLIRGHRFYAEDTTISLHRLFPISRSEGSSPDTASFSLPALSSLKPLDISDAYLIQASIEIQPDNQNAGANPELRSKATQQLLSIKDTLKEKVDLRPGERLALDTRVNARR